MTVTELKLLLIHLLNQPVAFKHLIGLLVAVWVYKRLRRTTSNQHRNNSRDAINKATYNPKQFRSRSKQEQDW
jgi:hypothetical protein